MKRAKPEELFRRHAIKSASFTKESIEKLMEGLEGTALLGHKLCACIHVDVELMDEGIRVIRSYRNILKWALRKLDEVTAELEGGD